ncbi:MAG: hypothetical protein SFT94_01635 [Pseudanabaenaceae cyanobacterium bins.68]|nr:hypothetical protein [Pseudanabaenaceae cyanobacterium bins.68]
MNQIKTDDYEIVFEPEPNMIVFKGSLRLNGMDEYAPIIDLLDLAAANNPSLLALKLEELEFLNSSGINMLSKFVIKMRQKGEVKIVVHGSKSIPWQGKSLKNLQRLMPSLEIELA